MTDDQYEQAASFWERHDATEKKMPEEEVNEWINQYLNSHQVLALAVGGDNFIRCTPLEYSWHDGALWIFTEGGLKFKAIRGHKHAAAAIFDTNTSFGGLKSLQIEGKIEVVEPFSEAYVKAAAAKKIPVETLKKLPEPMWLLKLTPNEITCLNSDFKKEGYGSRQHWQK